MSWSRGIPRNLAMPGSRQPGPSGTPVRILAVGILALAGLVILASQLVSSSQNTWMQRYYAHGFPEERERIIALETTWAPRAEAERQRLQALADLRQTHRERVQEYNTILSRNRALASGFPWKLLVQRPPEHLPLLPPP